MPVVPKFYSLYKRKNTLKALVGVAHGVITYFSDVYPSSNSDRLLFRKCTNLYDSLNPGDLIIDDKGFMIHHSVYVNIPPFLHTPQFSPSEVA